MTFLGADPDELDALAAHMDKAGEQLSTSYSDIMAQVVRSAWGGADADDFRRQWSGPVRRTFGLSQSTLSEAARTLRRNAEDQRRASAGTTTGNAGGTAQPRRPDLSRFPDEVAGRELLAELLGETGPGSIGEDQIQIRRLAGGRVIVIMPGITDLTSSRDAAVAGFRSVMNWRFAPLLSVAYPGFVPTLAVGMGAGSLVNHIFQPRGTVRALRNTAPTAFWSGNDDRYARRVMEALRTAGVSEGSEIMLVGHSGGAYAAASAAANPEFNALIGEGGKYRITHALAVGADTDQFLNKVPQETRMVTLNNVNDKIYRGEQLSALITREPLHSDGESATHHELVFEGAKRDFGHQPADYADYVRGGSRTPGFDQFTGSVSEMYGGPSQSENLSVAGY